jgi:hypothetical protein
LQALHQTVLTGEPSLQNSLELATNSLKLLPSHASKEILVIIGALTTCDPGDINETIRVRAHRIRARNRYLQFQECFQVWIFFSEYEGGGY